MPLRATFKVLETTPIGLPVAEIEIKPDYNKLFSSHTVKGAWLLRAPLWYVNLSIGKVERP